MHSGVTLHLDKVGGGDRDLPGDYGGIWGGTLKVYGGTVNIREFIGGDPAGNRTPGKAPALEVCGGMVFITEYYAPGAKGDVKIYGGSVYIGNPSGMNTAQGVGGGAVYQKQIILDASTLPAYGTTSNRKIVCGKINNVDCITDGNGTTTRYGLKDVETSGNSLYLWLPNGSHSIEMNQTNHCTPLRNTNGNTTLTPQSIQVTYKCVGAGCKTQGMSIPQTVQAGCR